MMSNMTFAAIWTKWLQFLHLKNKKNNYEQYLTFSALILILTVAEKIKSCHCHVIPFRILNSETLYVFLVSTNVISKQKAAYDFLAVISFRQVLYSYSLN